MQLLHTWLENQLLFAVMPKIEIRIDSQEKEIIREKAVAYGLNMSEYLRKLGLHDILPSVRVDLPQANKEAIKELNKIGNNLNQLTKLLHEEKLKGNINPVAPMTEKRISQTMQIVSESVMALKGEIIEEEDRKS